MPKKLRDIGEATARVEAALYSAGRPLKVEELIRASGTESRPKTLEILQGIIKRSRSAFRAIEVAVLPDGSYVFQLKPEYSSSIKRYASKPILPTATLKTLSYIALSQPVSSRDLVETRGSGVYAHLKELRQLDFISRQSVGRIKIYSTSEKFQKYFGLSGDAEDVKKRFFARVRQSPARPNAGSASAGGSKGAAGAEGGASIQGRTAPSE